MTTTRTTVLRVVTGWCVLCHRFCLYLCVAVPLSLSVAPPKKRWRSPRTTSFGYSARHRFARSRVSALILHSKPKAFIETLTLVVAYRLTDRRVISRQSAPGTRTEQHSSERLSGALLPTKQEGTWAEAGSAGILWGARLSYLFLTRHDHPRFPVRGWVRGGGSAFLLSQFSGTLAYIVGGRGKLPSARALQVCEGTRELSAIHTYYVGVAGVRPKVTSMARNSKGAAWDSELFRFVDVLSDKAFGELSFIN